MKEIAKKISNNELSIEDILSNNLLVQTDVKLKFGKMTNFFLSEEVLEKLINYSLNYNSSIEDFPHMSHNACEVLSTIKNSSLLDKLTFEDENISDSENEEEEESDYENDFNHNDSNMSDEIDVVIDYNDIDYNQLNFEKEIHHSPTKQLSSKKFSKKISLLSVYDESSISKPKSSYPYLDKIFNFIFAYNKLLFDKTSSLSLDEICSNATKTRVINEDLEIDDLFSGYFIRIFTNLISQRRSRMMKYLFIISKKSIEAFINLAPYHENIQHCLYLILENCEDKEFLSFQNDLLNKLMLKFNNQKCNLSYLFDCLLTEREIYSKYYVNNSIMFRSLISMLIDKIDTSIIPQSVKSTISRKSKKNKSQIVTNNEIFSLKQIQLISPNTKLKKENILIIKNILKNIVLDLYLITNYLTKQLNKEKEKYPQTPRQREIILKEEDLEAEEIFEEEFEESHLKILSRFFENFSLFNSIFEIIMKDVNSTQFENNCFKLENITKIECISLLLEIFVNVNYIRFINHNCIMSKLEFFDFSTYQVNDNKDTIKKFVYFLIDCLELFQMNTILHNEIEFIFSCFISEFSMENLISIFIESDVLDRIVSLCNKKVTKGNNLLSFINICEICVTIFASKNLKIQYYVEKSKIILIFYLLDSLFCHWYKEFFSPILQKMKEKLVDSQKIENKEISLEAQTVENTFNYSLQILNKPTLKEFISNCYKNVNKAMKTESIDDISYQILRKNTECLLLSSFNSSSMHLQHKKSYQYQIDEFQFRKEFVPTPFTIRNEDFYDNNFWKVSNSNISDKELSDLLL